MKPLKNWDNKTWLSSKRYISQFHKFIKRKTKLITFKEVYDILSGKFTKIYSPQTPFIFMSTNKVYGDNPNKLKIIEKKTRWELRKTDKNFKGIKEEHLELASETARIALAPRFVLFSLPSKSNKFLSIFF